MTKQNKKGVNQSHFSRVKQSFKQSLFYQSLTDIKALGNYNWLIVLFDILSLLTFLYLIPYLFITAFNQSTLYYISLAFGPLTNIALHGVRFIYAALLILGLVFFRYCILDAQSRLSSKFGLKAIWKIYFTVLVNFVVVYVALSVVMFLIQFSVRGAFVPYLRLIIVIPLAVAGYLYYNALVLEAFRNQRMTEAIRNAHAATFTVRNWSAYVAFIAALLIFSVLYILGNAFMYLVFKDVNQFQYAVYLYIMVALFFILMYLAVYFNRFYLMRLYGRRP